MAEPKPPKLSAWIGQWVAELRRSSGVTQEEVARAARKAGLDWKRSSVSALEAGRRDLTLEEALLLLVVLSEIETPEGPALIGTETRLVELLPPTDHLRLGAGEWPTAMVKALLTGEPLFEAITSGQADEIAARLWKQSRERAAEPWTAGLAEQTAARTLAVPASEIDRVARKLWKRTLTAERERRVTETAPPGANARSLQAIRGHVTRTLLAELRAALDASEGQE